MWSSYNTVLQQIQTRVLDVLDSRVSCKFRKCKGLKRMIYRDFFLSPVSFLAVAAFRYESCWRNDGPYD